MINSERVEHEYPREPYVVVEMEVVLENPENTVSTGDVAVDMTVCGGMFVTQKACVCK